MSDAEDLLIINYGGPLFPFLEQSENDVVVNHDLVVIPNGFI